MSEPQVAAPPATAYDAALAAASSDEERAWLTEFRLQHDLPANGPEWVVYALMARAGAAGKRNGKPPMVMLAPAALTAIEKSVERLARSDSGELSPEALAAIEEAVSRATDHLSAWRRPSSWAWLASVRAWWIGAKRYCWPPSAWPWPVVLGVSAVAILAFWLVAFTASVATRASDRVLAREMSTPAGVVALQLVRANPDLPAILARAPREAVPGGVAVTLRVWAPGPRPAARPTWLSAAQAVVAGWPQAWLAAGLAAALVAVALLAWIKRGAVVRRVA